MELYRSLKPGELLTGTDDPRFREAWVMASADSFAPSLDRAPDAPALAAE